MPRKIIKPNNTITEVTVEQVKYDVGLGQVSITTAMNFKLPIPMPGYTMMVLRSNAVTNPLLPLPLRYKKTVPGIEITDFV